MYYKYEKNKSIYIIPLIIIVTVALIPLFLLLFSKQLMITHGLTFFWWILRLNNKCYCSRWISLLHIKCESERQRIQLDKQLEAQKKIDIKVQSDFFKKATNN